MLHEIRAWKIVQGRLRVSEQSRSCFGDGLDVVQQIRSAEENCCYGLVSSSALFRTWMSAMTCLMSYVFFRKLMGWVVLTNAACYWQT